MESIPISKEEEMIRLQAMSLLLLSKTFRCRDADMLNAACEWANKSGDGSLLIWANSQIIRMLFFAVVIFHSTRWEKGRIFKDLKKNSKIFKMWYF